ncbi:hypothetical protein D3C73_1570830 [compost metagenome]
MVSIMPKPALSEKARISGVHKVSMKPRKKVKTDVRITRTSTPRFPEMEAQPSLNSW